MAVTFRKLVKHQLANQFHEHLSKRTSWKLRATNNQLIAGAIKMADQLISRARLDPKGVDAYELRQAEKIVEKRIAKAATV